jgi:hypothetical protein
LLTGMTNDPAQHAMTKTEAETTAPGSSPSAESVRAELRRILESRHFRMSKRCQEFLQFAVERTLAGAQSDLKERTIGSEVFGRIASYDTNEDAVVRIKASEVRKRLGLYYADDKTKAFAEVKIELPASGYVPFFSVIQSSITKEEAVEVLPEAIIPAKTSGQKWASKFLVFGVSLAVLAALIFTFREFGQPPSFLYRFWSPVLESKNPVLIVAAYAPVFVPRDPESSSSNTPLPDTYIQLRDQYVGGGDLIAATRISEMLTRMHHPYHIKVGSAVAFEDLRMGPAVLIGYSSTAWSPISKDFRYFIDDSNRGMITDFGKPTGWYPHNITADFHTDEDYAIISHAFDPQTRAMLVLISGCTQYGTEGAAELVTNPEMLAELLKGAPKDWQTRNFQLVLHMKVIANSPAAPQVVASYFW